MKQIEFVNILRGLSVMTVLISHYIGAYYVHNDAASYLINAPSINTDMISIPWYTYIWMNIKPIDFGECGVALFFIISGFVIPFSLRNNNLIQFIISRFFRVYPTYILGFSITLLAIFCSSEYFGNPWPFSLEEVMIHYIPGIRDICWSRRIDGVVWTLEIEVKFYLVCILINKWIKENSLYTFLTPIILFITSIYFMHNLNDVSVTLQRLYLTSIFFVQFIIYTFIGVAFNFLWLGKIEKKKFAMIVFITILMFLFSWKYGPYNGNFQMAINYILAVIVFFMAYRFSYNFTGYKIISFMADISYPFYVIHAISGYAVMRILNENGIGMTIAIIVALTLNLFIAYLMHISVENKSRKFSKFLIKKYRL